MGISDCSSDVFSSDLMLDSVGAGLLAGFIFGAGIAARGLREPGAARYEQIIVRETEARAAPLGDRAILAVVDEAGGAELSRDIGRDIEIEIAILRHGEDRKSVG